MALAHPTIRGRRYSRRDLQITLILESGAEVFVDIGDVSYSGAPLEEGYVIAEGQVIGRTRGDLGPVEGSFQMSKQEFQVLVERLTANGAGYKEVEFNALCSYSGPGLPTIVDTIEGIRIMTDEDAPSVGPDPLWVAVGWKAFNCKRDGKDPIAGVL